MRLPKALQPAHHHLSPVRPPALFVHPHLARLCAPTNSLQCHSALLALPLPCAARCLHQGTTMTLDLCDRQGKYSNGFAHWCVCVCARMFGLYLPH